MRARVRPTRGRCLRARHCRGARGRRHPGRRRNGIIPEAPAQIAARISVRVAARGRGRLAIHRRHCGAHVPRRIRAHKLTRQHGPAHCARHFGPDIQAREIADRGLVTTLAVAERQIVGFTQVTLAKAHPSVAAKHAAELNRIYVAAEHGRARASRRRSCAHLSRPPRPPAPTASGSAFGSTIPKAFAFYRKFGFEIVGEHSFMLGLERQRCPDGPPGS